MQGSRLICLYTSDTLGNGSDWFLPVPPATLLGWQTAGLVS